MRSNVKVVVLCSDYITALGLVRSLGEAGYRPECYCYGYSNYLLASRYISKGRLFKSKENAFYFLLNEYPCNEEKPVLLTIPDPPAYFVDLHKDELEKKFILQNAGAAGRVAYWMDKNNICQLAQKYGFDLPWSVVLNKNSEIPQNIEYPIFTKGLQSVGGGKCDEGICFSKAELQQKIKSMHSDNFLVMKYIHKKKEINYLGIAKGGKIYIDYHDIRERFPAGGYGHYNRFVKVKKDDFYQRIVDMMKETQYEGLFDVEFLLGQDDVMYFMEVNFRTDGEVYKLCEGVNLPAEWVRLAKLRNDELPEYLNTKKASFVGITEIDDFRHSVMSGEVNIFKWIWQFITADRRMLFNLKDPMPFFVKLWQPIKMRYDKSYLDNK